MKLKLLAIATIMMFSNIGFSQTNLKFAFEDEDNFPWAFKNKTGVNFILIEMAIKKIPEVKALTFEAVPWKRCLGTLETNDVDGCFSASYKTERDVHGAFPGAVGKPDPTKQLHSSTYALYTTKDSKVTYDGTKIQNLGTGAIGVPSGYSIGDDLKKQGYLVEDAGKSTEQNLKKMIAGRAVAIAALTETADYLLETPEFKGKVVRVKPNLAEKPYYLMLSHKLVKEKPTLAQKIWDEIATTRETAEYKTKVAAWLKTNAK